MLHSQKLSNTLPLSLFYMQCSPLGATEVTGLDNDGPNKMQGWQA